MSLSHINLCHCHRRVAMKQLASWHGARLLAEHLLAQGAASAAVTRNLGAGGEEPEPPQRWLRR